MVGEVVQPELHYRFMYRDLIRPILGRQVECRQAFLPVSHFVKEEKMPLSINDWMIWLKGLLSAFIGGGVTVLSSIVVETSRHGQFTSEDLKDIAYTAGVNAIVATALYLKSSPLPADLPEPGEKS